jgi:hypothetical protein
VVVGQASGDEVRRNLVTHAHIQVKPFARHIHQPVKHFQPHLQAWVLLHQPRHGGRHDLAAKAKAAAHTQQPARRTAGDRHLLQQLLHVVEDALRPAENTLALLRHRYAPGGAVQQLHLQILLQQADAFADVGGRGPQLDRRRAKAGLAHHGREHAQVFGGGMFMHDM